MVDNSELTTISELTPLVIYTVRVQAFTSMGAGPMSNPVKVKTQQGQCFSTQTHPLPAFVVFVPFTLYANEFTQPAAYNLTYSLNNCIVVDRTKCRRVAPLRPNVDCDSRYTSIHPSVHLFSQKKSRNKNKLSSDLQNFMGLRFIGGPRRFFGRI